MLTLAFDVARLSRRGRRRNRKKHTEFSTSFFSLSFSRCVFVFVLSGVALFYVDFFSSLLGFQRRKQMERSMKKKNKFKATKVHRNFCRKDQIKSTKVIKLPCTKPSINWIQKYYERKKAYKCIHKNWVLIISALLGQVIYQIIL